MADHEGDLAGLDATIVAELRSVGALHGRDGREAKLSHVRDLASRLAAAGLTPADLATAKVMDDQAVRRRAREKVIRQTHLEARAMSDAMVNTPRRRFEDRARRGHWSEFPSDPAPFYERFRPTVERVHALGPFKAADAADRVRGKLDGLDGPRRSGVDRLALHRAFHTAGLTLADASDDSLGAVGEMRTESWRTYLQLDWRSTGIDPAVYWQDLCELKLWEPYAIDHGQEQAWFRGAAAGEVDLIESILVDLEREHRDAVLDVEADVALASRAELAAAAGSPRAVRRP